MVGLQPVEAVEVTVVVDNFVDVLMAGSEGVVRFPVAYDLFDDRERDQLVAEHGFSALATTEASRRPSLTGGWSRPSGRRGRPRTGDGAPAALYPVAASLGRP